MTAPGLSSETRRLEAFAAIASSLAQSKDIDAAIATTLATTLETLGLPAGGVYLIDPTTRQLKVTRHVLGIPPEYRSAVAAFSPGEGEIGRALTSLRPVVVRDLSESAAARPATRDIGARTVVFVPLHARGRAVGVMPVGGFAVRDMAAEEIHFLSAVGGMLGAALDSAHLAEQQRRHLAEVEALWEIDRAILDGREQPEILETVAREAARLGGGDSAVALRESDHALTLASAHGMRARDALGLPLSLDGRPLEDLLQDPRPATLSLGEGKLAWRALVVPFSTNDGIAGAMVVVREGEAWSEEHADSLSAFAQRAAIALGRLRARQAEARRAGQLALLARASEVAASSLDPKALVTAIARYIQESFGYYSVAVYLVDRERREVVLAGAAGAAETLIPGDRFAVGLGIVGWVAENGQNLLAPDVRKEPRFRPSSLVATQSELAVAVRLGGETVAVINVESDVRGAFDEGDLVAIDGIASQIAGALRNARLFEEKLRALRNLEILQETTNVLNSDLDLDALLARIARRSVEAVPAADRGALLLFEDEELRVRSSWGYPHPGFLARVRLGFHQGLPGSVFVGGKGRLAAWSAETPGQEDPAFADAAGGVPARSALCVPVFLPREKLGVLLLESDAGTQAFEPADLRFAATLADQAAIAIGNALRLRRMEEMDKHRKAYLSNVSHELRTPLTVIQGYLEALVPLVEAGEPQKLAQTALDQGHRLGRRIDEILEVTRLETGVAQRHLEWSPVRLGDTVRSVVQSLRHEATLSGVTLVTEIDEAVPVLPGEERLLHLMVLNIVENAVKFTNAGGRVTVSLFERTGHAVLRVADDGIGIPPELVERVFEKFFMADAGPTKARGGAGIGLYLVREIVQIHDGTISVVPAPGRGTLFEVSLPIRPLA